MTCRALKARADEDVGLIYGEILRSILRRMLVILLLALFGSNTFYSSVCFPASGKPDFEKSLPDSVYSSSDLIRTKSVNVISTSRAISILG